MDRFSFMQIVAFNYRTERLHLDLFHWTDSRLQNEKEKRIENLRRHRIYVHTTVDAVNLFMLMKFRSFHLEFVRNYGETISFLSLPLSYLAFTRRTGNTVASNISRILCTSGGRHV